MFRRLFGTAMLAAIVVVGLSACSEPCHHPCEPDCCPVESSWVCPVDGSIDCQPSTCPHCGAIRMQRTANDQQSTTTSYHVK